MIFKTENFKMLPRDYEVKISSQGIAHFAGDIVEYFVAPESSSKYEG